MSGAELNHAISSAVRNNMPTDLGLDRSLELTSVAVVPDGMAFVYLNEFGNNNLGQSNELEFLYNQFSVRGTMS